MKERTSLRKEIATLQTTFKEQRAKNENLKRAKVILLSFILYLLLFISSKIRPSCLSSLSRSIKIEWIIFAILLLYWKHIPLKISFLDFSACFWPFLAEFVCIFALQLDLNLHSSATNLIAYFDGAENAIASQAHQRTAPPSFSHFPSHLLSHVTPYVHPYPQLDSCDEHKAVSSPVNNSFVLPDLNMVPSEDSGSEILYGMSWDGKQSKAKHNGVSNVT